MASSLKQKFKNIGPGALVAAGFVGPGTVTTCTVSGASYGYTMLWCLLFATDHHLPGDGLAHRHRHPRGSG